MQQTGSGVGLALALGRAGIVDESRFDGRYGPWFVLLRAWRDDSRRGLSMGVGGNYTRSQNGHDRLG